MTNQEILTKAIEKAIAGGWEQPKYGASFGLEGLSGADWGQASNQQLVPWIIFNHDFAKALWGEEMRDYFPFAHDGDYKYGEHMPEWVWHLQKMVIAEDPIKYLGDNI